MQKFLVRVVALLLIPCITADPGMAAALQADRSIAIQTPQAVLFRWQTLSGSLLSGYKAPRILTNTPYLWPLLLAAGFSLTRVSPAEALQILPPEAGTTLMSRETARHVVFGVAAISFLGGVVGMAAAWWQYRQLKNPWSMRFARETEDYYRRLVVFGFAGAGIGLIVGAVIGSFVLMYQLYAGNPPAPNAMTGSMLTAAALAASLVLLGIIQNPDNRDPTTTPELAGERIRTLRQAKGWTLQELADRLEISPAYLSFLETGRRPLSYRLCVSLGVLLDIDGENFWEQNVKPHQSPRAGISSMKPEAGSVDAPSKLEEVPFYIRKKRLAKRLTPTQLAYFVGISAGYVSLLENGKRPLTKESLHRFGAALDFDGQKLWDELAEASAAAPDVARPIQPLNLTQRILLAVKSGINYGEAIAKETNIQKASVYTTLYRLLQRKLVRSRYGDPENTPMRRIYELTAAGEEFLAEIQKSLTLAQDKAQSLGKNKSDPAASPGTGGFKSRRGLRGWHNRPKGHPSNIIPGSYGESFWLFIVADKEFAYYFPTAPDYSVWRKERGYPPTQGLTHLAALARVGLLLRDPDTHVRGAHIKTRYHLHPRVRLVLSENPGLMDELLKSAYLNEYFGGEVPRIESHRKEIAEILGFDPFQFKSDSAHSEINNPAAAPASAEDPRIAISISEQPDLPSAHRRSITVVESRAVRASLGDLQTRHEKMMESLGRLIALVASEQPLDPEQVGRLGAESIGEDLPDIFPALRDSENQIRTVIHLAVQMLQHGVNRNARALRLQELQEARNDLQNYFQNSVKRAAEFAAATEHDSGGVQEITQGRTLRVLVLSDAEDLVFRVQQLKRLPYQYDVADVDIVAVKDKEALVRAWKDSGGKLFDMAVLGGSGGESAATQLRDLAEERKANLPIIVIQNKNSLDMNLARRFGLRGMSRLEANLGVLELGMELELDLKPRDAKTSANPRQLFHVLVADDSSIDRGIHQGAVIDAALQAGVAPSQLWIETAGNGKEELDKVRAAWERQTPFHSIISDYSMPLMKGDEVTKAVRQGESDQGYQHVPIAIVTATPGQSDDPENPFLKAGATQVFNKGLRREGHVYQPLIDFLVPLMQNFRDSYSAVAPASVSNEVKLSERNILEPRGLLVRGIRFWSSSHRRDYYRDVRAKGLWPSKESVNLFPGFIALGLSHDDTFDSSGLYPYGPLDTDNIAYVVDPAYVRSHSGSFDLVGESFKSKSRQLYRAGLDFLGLADHKHKTRKSAEGEDPYPDEIQTGGVPAEAIRAILVNNATQAGEIRALDRAFGFTSLPIYIVNQQERKDRWSPFDHTPAAAPDSNFEAAIRSAGFESVAQAVEALNGYPDIGEGVRFYTTPLNPIVRPTTREIETRRLAVQGLRGGDAAAIHIAAAEMAPHIPRGAVLIPIPSSQGDVTINGFLIDAIHTLRPDVRRVDAIEQARTRRSHRELYHEAQYHLTPDSLGFRRVPQAVETIGDSLIIFIDNTISSGVTFQAAHEVLGHRGRGLAFARNDGYLPWEMIHRLSTDERNNLRPYFRPDRLRWLEERGVFADEVTASAAAPKGPDSSNEQRTESSPVNSVIAQDSSLLAGPSPAAAPGDKSKGGAPIDVRPGSDRERSRRAGRTPVGSVVGASAELRRETRRDVESSPWDRLGRGHARRTDQPNSEGPPHSSKPAAAAKAPPVSQSAVKMALPKLEVYVQTLIRSLDALIVTLRSGNALDVHQISSMFTALKQKAPPKEFGLVPSSSSKNTIGNLLQALYVQINLILEHPATTDERQGYARDLENLRHTFEAFLTYVQRIANSPVESENPAAAPGLGSGGQSLGFDPNRNPERKRRERNGLSKGAWDWDELPGERQLRSHAKRRESGSSGDAAAPTVPGPGLATVVTKDSFLRELEYMRSQLTGAGPQRLIAVTESLIKEFDDLFVPMAMTWSGADVQVGQGFALAVAVGLADALLQDNSIEGIKIVTSAQRAGQEFSWEVGRHFVASISALATNAVRAMQEMRERKLTIETGQQDDEIFMRVSDTGHGIPSKIIDKIWDYGFTTKPTREGGGLGLFFVAREIENVGGRKAVESHVGKGTKFTLWVPKSPKVLEKIPAAAPLPGRQAGASAEASTSAEPTVDESADKPDDTKMSSYALLGEGVLLLLNPVLAWGGLAAWGFFIWLGDGTPHRGIARLARVLMNHMRRTPVKPLSKAILQAA